MQRERKKNCFINIYNISRPCCTFLCTYKTKFLCLHVWHFYVICNVLTLPAVILHGRGIYSIFELWSKSTKHSTWSHADWAWLYVIKINTITISIILRLRVTYFLFFSLQDSLSWQILHKIFYTHSVFWLCEHNFVPFPLWFALLLSPTSLKYNQVGMFAD